MDGKLVQDQLKDYSSFQMSPNQKSIVQTLSAHLGDREDILAFQEGFYDGVGIKDSATGVFGFLVVTSRKVFFISNEKQQTHRYEQLSPSDTGTITVKKNFASMSLQFQGQKNIQFRAVIPYTQALELADQIKTRWGIDTPVQKKEQAESGYRIFDRPLNSQMLDRFLDKVNTVSRDILSRITDDKQAGTPAIQLLFGQVKEIYQELEAYQKTPTLKNLIVDDLVMVSSMSTMADLNINREETLFLALLFITLEKGKAVANDEVDSLFQADTLKTEHQELVDKYKDIVAKKIKSVTYRADEYPLKGLRYVKGYDKKEGTLHFSNLARLYNTCAECIVKADGAVTPAEEELLKNINMIIHEPWEESPAPTASTPEEQKLKEKIKEEKESEEEPETLEDVMKDLNRLIGMQNIKEQINTFINLIKVQKAREEKDLPVSSTSLHAVFYGPPGTGKTTTARLLGRIYKCLGLLKKGHITETDRAGLVAGYVGQTAIKTDEMIQKSLDGILFIDEAYALAPGDSGKDFGQEAIDTILKRMEDYRERLVIIVAGYPDEMKDFINSNPGLKSRFSRYFNFDHYTPGELMGILEIFTKKSKFTLTKGAREKLLVLFTEYYEARDKSFGNGRLSRNLFEKIIEKQANRIASVTPLTEKVLSTIKSADIPVKDEMVL